MVERLWIMAASLDSGRGHMQRLRPTFGLVVILLAPALTGGCGQDSRPPTTENSVFGAREQDELIKQRRLRRQRAVLLRTQAARNRSGARRAPARERAAGDDAGFARLSRNLGGSSGVAIAGPTPRRLGTWTNGVAWSSIKVPLAVAALEDGASAATARRAITASDNAAAEQLWAQLGAGVQAGTATEAVLREAGDHETRVQTARVRAGFTPFGQTRWSLAAQARFMAGLPCVPGAAPVLALMGEVVADQRWGLGRIGARFKGGWGPEPSGGYEVRQMGLVPVAGGDVAVAIANAPADGAFATGTANLTRIAEWVKNHVAAADHVTRSC